MNQDLPDWIINMKEEDEEKMKLHNEKVDELMNEVNGMVERVTEMINEGKRMQKVMQNRLEKAIRRWAFEKKK